MRLPASGRNALVAAVLAAAGACGGDPVRPPAARLTLVFEHEVDGVPLALDTLACVNAAGNGYSVTKLRYYVCDLVLHAEGGGRHGVGAVHYVDAESAAASEWVLEGLPAGRYTSATFTFGLDAARNRTGALANTLRNARMAWPEVMGGGYHYMQLEGHYQAASGRAGYAVHTGRLQMAADAAPHHHFFSVTLPFPAFDASSGRWRLHIVMNVNEWFANPEVYDFAAFPPNIMSEIPAQERLMRNGGDVFRVARVAGP